MRTICLYFQVHQPYRLRWYRFFDIGNEHYYYDDFLNRSIMKKVAEKCYLPTNKIMLELIKQFGSKFKVAFSISGTALEQFEEYAPDVLKSFQELAKTGCVEFLAETDSHSLASLKSKEEFVFQVNSHRQKIEKYFGQTPQVFRNTELIYSDNIGEMVAEMGYKAMITEGAKHVLGWKSPNFLYFNAINPKLKLLLKNYKLSDDIAFRFSNKTWKEWPLTADKYAIWLNEIDKNEDTVNIFMDYESFGEHQSAETGIFNFLRALPEAVLKHTNFTFATPTEVADIHQPVAAMHCKYPISWADEERDLTAWLGNELQDEAFEKVYEMRNIVLKTLNVNLVNDWNRLQASDHFYYMCTKFFADGDVHSYFNPYNNPYDAFINFMNVFADFSIRVKEEIKRVQYDVMTANEINQKIDELNSEIEKLRQRIKPKANVIDKTKKVPEAIEKTKKEVTPIEKTKKEVKPIEKTKKEVTPIEKTKAEPKKIEKTKEEVKVLPEKSVKVEKKVTTKKKVTPNKEVTKKEEKKTTEKKDDKKAPIKKTTTKKKE